MKESTYKIPFFHIPYNSKIVLYGGGKWGEYYFRKIKQSNCAEIVAILDAQAKNVPPIFGKTPIYEPDKVRELNFDYICISVEDTNHVENIKWLLQDYGIPAYKILWNSRQMCGNERALYEIIKCFDRNIENENRRFFLFMLPEHGNLGDYAIGYAEFSFFKKYFSQYEVYGVTTSEWIAASKFYLQLIRPKDIIFLNGGGFLGDLWGNTEIYQHIVENFPRNIKIFFPNSLTYKKKLGKENKVFMKDIEWFGKQENLFVFFREYSSYYLFHQHEKRCYLFPDMVFSLCYEKNEFYKKNKVLLCLRNDRERVFDKKDRLENCLKNVGIEYDIYDICIGKYISQQAGQELLKNTVLLFQSYDCVITDRLHGMILAVISNVPCIAFDSYTHKISSVFEFIKDLQYVKLITENEVDTIDKLIYMLYENKRKAEPYRPPVKEYEKMANTIYEIMNCIV